jgi:hypothetical protein
MKIKIKILSFAGLAVLAAVIAFLYIIIKHITIKEIKEGVSKQNKNTSTRSTIVKEVKKTVTDMKPDLIKMGYTPGNIKFVENQYIKLKLMKPGAKRDKAMQNYTNTINKLHSSLQKQGKIPTLQ